MPSYPASSTIRATAGASAGLFMNGVPHQNCIVLLGSAPRAGQLSLPTVTAVA